MSHIAGDRPPAPKRLAALLFLALILVTMAVLGILGLLTTELIDIFLRILRVASQFLQQLL